MNGLYALKPWYARRLAGVRSWLVARRVSPNALTAGGGACGAAAGVALAGQRPGPVAALVVGVLLAVRLACANLDGGVAREAGTGTRFGSVANELGDRLAEFAALSGTLALAPAAAVAGAGLASTLPSWVALAGAAAGAPRQQGGPVGKTERCLLLILIAGTGWALPLLAVMALGSVATAVLRVLRVRRFLRAAPVATGVEVAAAGTPVALAPLAAPVPGTGAAAPPYAGVAS